MCVCVCVHKVSPVPSVSGFLKYIYSFQKLLRRYFVQSGEFVKWHILVVRSKRNICILSVRDISVRYIRRVNSKPLLYRTAFSMLTFHCQK